MSQTITELNKQTDDALKARATEAAKPAPKTRAPRKPTAPKAPVKPVVKPAGRKALTPKERAARPVTATIAAYVEWLDKTVYGGKMTAQQKSVAGISITLYGNYQISPERRAARGVR